MHSKETAKKGLTENFLHGIIVKYNTPKYEKKEKPKMLMSVILFAVGLVLLIKGGDWFVDGATGLAKRFNLPDIVVGATVVSIGTTLPEVMVSTTGALQGSGAMAYGNAIGSIICNTALIAAISIVCNPGPVNVKSMKTPALFFFASAGLYCLAAYGLGTFPRWMGFVMLAIFVAYTVLTVRNGLNFVIAKEIGTVLATALNPLAEETKTVNIAVEPKRSRVPAEICQ